MGLYDEALAELDTISEMSGDDAPTFRAALHAQKGQPEEALEIVSSLDLEDYALRAPSAIAQVYAALGDRDQAFAWLEKSFELREMLMVQIKIWGPPLSALRSDPRYDSLVRRMNFPE